MRLFLNVLLNLVASIALGSFSSDCSIRFPLDRAPGNGSGFALSAKIWCRRSAVWIASTSEASGEECPGTPLKSSAASHDVNFSPLYGTSCSPAVHRAPENAIAVMLSTWRQHPPDQRWVGPRPEQMSFHLLSLVVFVSSHNDHSMLNKKLAFTADDEENSKEITTQRMIFVLNSGMNYQPQVVTAGF